MRPLIDIARDIVEARATGRLVASSDWDLREAADAYAVQDLSLALAGHAIGGWKVGAANRPAEPHCAPIPAGWLLKRGAEIHASEPLVEVEVAFRLAVDIPAGFDFPTPTEWPSCLDAVLPVMEWVDSRLAEGQAASRLAKLADSQSLGALVLGAPTSLTERALDLRGTRARLWLDEALECDVRGGHPSGDLVGLLGWLARHCASRGTPLCAGQIVTTGSCIGMARVGERQRARGEIDGLGAVEAEFLPSWHAGSSRVR